MMSGLCIRICQMAVFILLIETEFLHGAYAVDVAGPNSNKNLALGSGTTAALSIGSYVPYTWGDQLRVTATLVSSPERLKTVDVGLVFKLDDLWVNMSTHNKLLDSALEGKIVLMDIGIDGAFEVDPKNDLISTSWPKFKQCSGSKTIANTSGSDTSGNCSTAFAGWLEQQKNTGKFIVSSSSVDFATKPVGQVINWSASIPYTTLQK